MRFSSSISGAAGPNLKRSVVSALVLCLAVGLGVAASNANAAVLTFTLNQSNITGYSTGTFGTATLTDIGSGTVQVSEDMAPNFFANTGAAYSLEFTLNGNPTITGSDITNLSFSGPGVTSSSGYALLTGTNVKQPSGLSPFGVAVDCTACGSGSSPPQYNQLVFDITDTGGLSTSDFIAQADGTYFLSDINIGGTKLTGYAYTNNPGVPTTVPEPGTLALLAVGLAALGFAVSRRRKVKTDA